MNLIFLYHLLVLFATAAFAASAILSVSKHNIDTFAAIVLGVITAIGGGTIRDVILGVPIFWAVDQSYVWVALIVSFLTYIISKFFQKRSSKKNLHLSVLYLDGFGAALFAISTTRHVWNLNFCLPLGPIMLGVVTAIGGGLMRDALVGQRTLLMSREIYTILILFGCILFLILQYFFPQYTGIISILCICLIFVTRSAAIYWKISMPHWIEYCVAKVYGKKIS